MVQAITHSTTNYVSKLLMIELAQKLNMNLLNMDYCYSIIHTNSSIIYFSQQKRKVGQSRFYIHKTIEKVIKSYFHKLSLKQINYNYITMLIPSNH